MLFGFAPVAFLLLAAYKLFVVPRNLSHLPRVPLLPLLKSYITREPEDQRTRRLLLPYANEHGYPLVLVWVFGTWIIHVIDHETGIAAFKNPAWLKQSPPQDLLLWNFVGRQSIPFTNGEVWRRHSRLMAGAFQGPPPFRDFIAIANRLFKVLGEGTKKVAWNELSQQITLDVLGRTVLGYDFEVLVEPNSLFARGYRHVMHALMEPPYIFLPFLDKYFPRRDVEAEVRNLRRTFGTIIEKKRNTPGNDLISRMISNPEFKYEEVLDNVSTLFVAGHDTTAAALTSLVYYLAKHPEHQAKARAEVMLVLGENQDPNLNTVSQMTYVFACIKEALRMQSPGNVTTPRSADVTTQLGPYTIPPHTLMVFNIVAVHHLDKTFPRHDEFNPENFAKDGVDSTYDLVAFGLGLRRCPARNFAMWQLRTVAAMLLRSYEWSLPKGTRHAEQLHNTFSFAIPLNIPDVLEIFLTKRETLPV